MPIRVLSIDGGGVRGILPATLLATLEDRSGHRIADLFDMAVGTSTGGILVLGLLAPNDSGRPARTARQLLELYHQRGTDIFPLGGEPVVHQSGLFGTRTELPPNASFGDRFRRFMGYENIEKLVAPLGGGRNARYPATGLEMVLRESLGDVRMSQALRPIVITSYEYETRRPVLFRSYDAGSDPLMREVARATSAGPTFFPVAEIAGLPGQYIDGGVFANDPAFVAFMESLSIARSRGRSEDILLVSIGTGMPRGEESADDDVPLQLVDRLNWAELAADHLMTAIFNGAAQAHRVLLAQLLNDSQPSYWRYQTVLKEANFAMDDARPENLAALQREGDRLIAENAASLDALLHLLAPA